MPSMWSVLQVADTGLYGISLLVSKQVPIPSPRKSGGGSRPTPSGQGLVFEVQYTVGPYEERRKSCLNWMISRWYLGTVHYWRQSTFKLGERGTSCLLDLAILAGFSPLVVHGKPEDIWMEGVSVSKPFPL
jgi:hypothetical protein